MYNELKLRIKVENPTMGVDFGLQKGSGNNYVTVQKQRSTGESLSFELVVKLKTDGTKAAVFSGEFAQGSTTGRFIYIDIGKCAGQQDTPWSRRLKIPLTGITTEMTRKAMLDPDQVLETIVAGTGKDGGPNCGTVKPFDGWKLTAYK